MTLGSAPSGLSIKRGMEIAVHEINQQGGLLGKKLNIIVQDHALIRDALERIEFHQGLVKTYSPPFTPKRHDALEEKDYIMAKYDNRGRIIPVKNPVPD